MAPAVPWRAGSGPLLLKFGLCCDPAIGGSQLDLDHWINRCMIHCPIGCFLRLYTSYQQGAGGVVFLRSLDVHTIPPFVTGRRAGRWFGGCVAGACTEEASVIGITRGGVALCYILDYLCNMRGWDPFSFNLRGLSCRSWDCLEK